MDTYTDADSHVVSDPRQAVRLDRDVYDDAGHLVRREWWYVADGGDWTSLGTRTGVSRRSRSAEQLAARVCRVAHAMPLDTVAAGRAQDQQWAIGVGLALGAGGVLPMREAAEDESGCAAAADGTSCDDENPCTSDDACHSGRCVGVVPEECPTPGQCQVGVCDPTTGACDVTFRAVRHGVRRWQWLHRQRLLRRQRLSARPAPLVRRLRSVHNGRLRRGGVRARRRPVPASERRARGSGVPE